MDLKYYSSYFLFHSLIHLLSIGVIFIVFQLNLQQLILIFLASAAIDADHLPFIKKKGVRYWMKVHGSHIIKSYPLHNFLALIIFFIASLFVLDPELFIIGICSLSVALHLLWDLVEDAFVFGMGIKHWNV